MKQNNIFQWGVGIRRSYTISRRVLARWYHGSRGERGGRDAVVLVRLGKVHHWPHAHVAVARSERREADVPGG